MRMHALAKTCLSANLSEPKTKWMPKSGSSLVHQAPPFHYFGSFHVAHPSVPLCPRPPCPPASRVARQNATLAGYIFNRPWWLYTKMAAFHHHNCQSHWSCLVSAREFWEKCWRVTEALCYWCSVTMYVKHLEKQLFGVTLVQGKINLLRRKQIA